MARTREKIKGRRESGSFIMLPHAVIEDPNFVALSAQAVKLFIDLYGQYKGSNNGDLCAAWSVMQKRGWRSKATLFKALRELDARGLIMTTRQGGRKLATLYAVTFKDIDKCNGKLDVNHGPAPGTWRTQTATIVMPQQIQFTEQVKYTTSEKNSLPQISSLRVQNKPPSDLKIAQLTVH